MKSRKSLLNSLLQVLVDEWGHEEVMAACAKIATSSNDPLLEGTAGPKLRASRVKNKLSATEQIERTAVDGMRRELLLQLAEHYDQKQFLPGLADVREFLIMMGEIPSGMKDRKEAFRVLLRSLLNLPIDRLQQLAKTTLHSGPSELGPLSDAITAAGERLPRQREAKTD